MIIIIAYILIDLNKITIVQQWFEKKITLSEYSI